MKVPANFASIADYLTVGKNQNKGTEKKTTVPSEDILKQSQGQTMDEIIVKQGVGSRTPVKTPKPIRSSLGPSQKRM